MIYYSSKIDIYCCLLYLHYLILQAKENANFGNYKHSKFMPNRFYKTNFRFVANRYEEWQAGRCISKGPIATEIVAEVSGNSIHFELDDIGNIRMLKSFDFDIYGEDYCILQDRIQYALGTNDFNPIVPIVCNIFYRGNTMEYVRFAMTNPDRLVEFYGTLVQCGQPSTCRRTQMNTDNANTAEKILNELRGYGMLNTGAVFERAVKLFNVNSKVANVEQLKAILESLKLFVKALTLDQDENDGEATLATPNILMYIALCNFKIGNMNQAYWVAKRGLDAIDDALENSPLIVPKSQLGEETLNLLIKAIEAEHAGDIEYDEFSSIDPFEIDTRLLDIAISKMSTNNEMVKPTKEIIQKMIDTISQIQDQFVEAAEQIGDAIKGVQMRNALEQFKFPLFFAWQGYKYGWHTDWCKEGDSLFPFMMFEANMKNNTQDLIDMLQTQSPFVYFERNSAITKTLIAIYKTFINDIDNNTIKV